MSKKTEAEFAAHVRHYIKQGDEVNLLGRKVRVIRVGFYSGAYFEAGVVLGYWDDQGIWREYQITPAEVEGIFPRSWLPRWNPEE